MEVCPRKDPEPPKSITCMTPVKVKQQLKLLLLNLCLWLKYKKRFRSFCW